MDFEMVEIELIVIEVHLVSLRARLAKFKEYHGFSKNIAEEEATNAQIGALEARRKTILTQC